MRCLSKAGNTQTGTSREEVNGDGIVNIQDLVLIPMRCKNHYETGASMKKLNIRPFSTPLIIGAGIFSALTGLLMFFVSEDPFKFAHELVGIGFSVAIVLHISTNWRPFKRYFKQRGVAIITLAWVVGISLVTTSALLNRGESDRLVVEQIERTSIFTLSQVVGMSENALVIQLANDGFVVDDPEITVEELAEHLEVDTDDILLSVFR